MIEIMATVHMSETEAARDLHAVLARVEQGVEVAIEGDGHRPVAVIRSPHRSGRPLTEILSEARDRGSKVTLDEEFGDDLEAIIASHQAGPPVGAKPACWPGAVGAFGTTGRQ